MSLTAYLPQDRRRALARGAALPERCHGAALFADISGFTPLTEALALGRGPRGGADELVRRVNAVHEVLVAAVDRNGGSVVAFAGDGMTCWFDDADDGPGAAGALHCARTLQHAMLAFPGLALKVGIAAGSALRTAAGDPAIQRIDVLAGATAARAVAAQALAGAGEVVVDAAVAACAGAGQVGARRADDGGAVYRALTRGALADDAVVAAHAAAPEAPEAPAETLRPWVPAFVAERETASGGLFAADLRPAAALFVRAALGVAPVADTGLTESVALDTLVVRTQRVLRRHGGVLLEVSVDATGICLYASLGAAQAHEDDAARALRAALQIARECDAAGLALQIGASYGTLCVGGYGGAARRSFGALGDAVNEAARLTALAQPGEILVSGRLRQRVADDDFAFDARAPVALKGKAEPLAVFAATGLQPRRALRLQEPPARLPMVGRAAEARRLVAAIDAARDGRAQFVRIVAEAGMGKSRLVAEGIRSARRAGFLGYGGACGQDGVRTPYLVWQGICTAFFEVDPTLPPRRQRRAAQAALQRLAPEHAEAWPLLDAVLGHEGSATPFSAALAPKDRKALLETMLARCLQSAAAEAAEDGIGLLFVLEDLHAADALSIDLLEAALRACAALPVIVLAAERSADGAGAALAARLGAAVATQVIELGGLGAADVEHVVRAKLAQLFPERGGGVPPDLLERVAARAQGNPFYIEELLAYLHDRGIDPRRPGAAQELELPSSLHSLVLSRIDQLPARQGHAMKAASIIGREFALADLHGYCPTLGSAEAVAADLGALDRLGFTAPLPDAAETRHVFRHPITLEVSYESIGLQTRADLHARYARHLEQQRADPAALAPELAHHYARAQQHADACRWLRRAGEQAAARFANDEALAHFEQALAWLPAGDDAARFDLLVQRCAIDDLQGRRERQRADIAELERLAPRLPDATARRARAAGVRATLEIELGDYAAAAASARAALAILDADPAAELPALRVDTLLLQSKVMLHSGDGAAARPQLDAALALARTHGLRRAQAAALSNIGLVHWHAGDFAAAETRLGEALALARADGDPRLQLNTLNSLGVVAKSMARHDAAAAHYRAAQAIAERIGDRSGAAMLLNNVGSACLAGGRFHDAARHCETAAQRFAASGETVLHGLALANQGEAQRELGRPGRALDLGHEALALLRAGGSRPGEALVLENLGLAAAALGQADDAHALLDEAVGVARAIGRPAREASALLHRGELQTRAGTLDAAAASLARARHLAAALGDEALVLEIDIAEATLALARGDATAALAHLEAPLAGPLGAAADTLPVGLHAAALRLLQACGDARGPAVRARGRRALARCAAAIPDREARRDYLAQPALRVFTAGGSGPLQR